MVRRMAETLSQSFYYRLKVMAENSFLYDPNWKHVKKWEIILSPNLTHTQMITSKWDHEGLSPKCQVPGRIVCKDARGRRDSMDKEQGPNNQRVQ